MLNVPNFTVLTDVNECEKGQINLCDKYAFCNNIRGSYSCHCKQGSLAMDLIAHVRKQKQRMLRLFCTSMIN